MEGAILSTYTWRHVICRWWWWWWCVFHVLFLPIFCLSVCVCLFLCLAHARCVHTSFHINQKRLISQLLLGRMDTFLDFFWCKKYKISSQKVFFAWKRTRLSKTRHSLFATNQCFVRGRHDRRWFHVSTFYSRRKDEYPHLFVSNGEKWTKKWDSKRGFSLVERVNLARNVINEGFSK